MGKDESKEATDLRLRHLPHLRTASGHARHISESSENIMQIASENGRSRDWNALLTMLQEEEKKVVCWGKIAEVRPGRKYLFFTLGDPAQESIQIATSAQMLDLHCVSSPCGRKIIRALRGVRGAESEFGITVEIEGIPALSNQDVPSIFATKISRILDQEPLLPGQRKRV